MKFFQKRGVAITITLILIVAALLIGKPWASSNTATASAANSDYLSYIADDANALTNDARIKVADYMETLDSKYGSIVALMTITDTDGETMEDYAKSVWDEAEFLDSDMRLVVNTETGEWYLQPGSEIAPYADASLESLFTNDLDNANLADGGQVGHGSLQGSAQLVRQDHPQGEQHIHGGYRVCAAARAAAPQPVEDDFDHSDRVLGAEGDFWPFAPER